MHGTYINIAVPVYSIDGLFNDAVGILENMASKMTLK
jgi:hypothetical protein